MNVNLQEYIHHILKYLMMRSVKRFLPAKIEIISKIILEIFGEKIFLLKLVKN